MRVEPALFDLDGTLVDSVYQHVLAWKRALDAEGIELSVWRIHRKIGMSGGLVTNKLLHEIIGAQLPPGGPAGKLSLQDLPYDHRLRRPPGARDLGDAGEAIRCGAAS